MMGNPVTCISCGTPFGQSCPPSCPQSNPPKVPEPDRDKYKGR